MQQMMFADAARRIILPFYPALIRGQEKAETEARSRDSSQRVRRFVRKILSPGSMADVPYLCNDLG